MLRRWKGGGVDRRTPRSIAFIFPSGLCSLPMELTVICLSNFLNRILPQQRQ